MTKEVFLSLFEDERVQIELIDSFGSESDVYQQDHDEWVYLLKGEAVLEMGCSKIFLIEGDSLFIEKNQIHRVTYTSQDCKWLAIHLLQSVQK